MTRADEAPPSPARTRTRTGARQRQRQHPAASCFSGLVVPPTTLTDTDDGDLVLVDVDGGGDAHRRRRLSTATATAVPYTAPDPSTTAADDDDDNDDGLDESRIVRCASCSSGCRRCLVAAAVEHETSTWTTSAGACEQCLDGYVLHVDGDEYFPPPPATDDRRRLRDAEFDAADGETAAGRCVLGPGCEPGYYRTCVRTQPPPPPPPSPSPSPSASPPPVSSTATTEAPGDQDDEDLLDSETAVCLRCPRNCTFCRQHQTAEAEAAAAAVVECLQCELGMFVESLPFSPPDEDGHDNSTAGGWGQLLGASSCLNGTDFRRGRRQERATTTECVADCDPDDHYVNATQVVVDEDGVGDDESLPVVVVNSTRCEPCDDECLGCRGPAPSDCRRCRNYLDVGGVRCVARCDFNCPLNTELVAVEADDVPAEKGQCRCISPPSDDGVDVGTLVGAVVAAMIVAVAMVLTVLWATGCVRFRVPPSASSAAAATTTDGFDGDGAGGRRSDWSSASMAAGRRSSGDGQAAAAAALSAGRSASSSSSTPVTVTVVADDSGGGGGGGGGAGGGRSSRPPKPPPRRRPTTTTAPPAAAVAVAAEVVAEVEVGDGGQIGSRSRKPSRSEMFLTRVKRTFSSPNIHLVFGGGGGGGNNDGVTGDDKMLRTIDGSKQDGTPRPSAADAPFAVSGPEIHTAGPSAPPPPPPPTARRGRVTRAAAAEFADM